MADEEQVDIIAMGTHARGGFARAVLGSLAASTLHGAHVPVLVCSRAVHSGSLTREAGHQASEVVASL
jgi:nucleotide-binding universal stress UspA family protein